MSLTCGRHLSKEAAGKGSSEVENSSGITIFSASAPVTACSVKGREC